MQSRAEKDKNDLKNFVNEQNDDRSDGVRDVHEKSQQLRWCQKEG